MPDDVEPNPPVDGSDAGPPTEPVEPVAEPPAPAAPAAPPGGSGEPPGAPPAAADAEPPGGGQPATARNRILLIVGGIVLILLVVLLVAVANDDDDVETGGTTTTGTDGTTTSATGAATTTLSSGATTTTSSSSGAGLASVIDLDATDSSSVWALGSMPCGPDTCAGLAHSADGGASWTPVALPEGVLADDTAGVRFGSADDGYVFGVSLLVTHDGGSTWATPPGWSPVWTRVLDLQPEGDDVLAVVSTCDVSAEPCSVLLLHSVNAGESWDAVDPQPELSASDAEMVRFADGLAWLLTTDGGASAPRLYTANDGGAAWSEGTVPCGADVGLVARLAAVDGSHWWLACGGDLATIQQGKAVYSTSDGGGSYTPAADPGLSGHLAGLGSPSASRAFLGLQRGSLLGTADTGGSWADAVAIGEVCESGFGVVRFVDPDHGWAAAADPACAVGTVWRTTDGGSTWQVAELA